MTTKRQLTVLFVLAALAGAIFTATAFGDEPNSRCNDRDIDEAGTVVTVRADCRVHGDVTYWKPGSNIRFKPDDLRETGQILWCVSRCRVKFESGGGISGQPISSLALDMTSDGCGLSGGCKRIDLRISN